MPDRNAVIEIDSFRLAADNAIQERDNELKPTDDIADSLKQIELNTSVLPLLVKQNKQNASDTQFFVKQAELPQNESSSPINRQPILQAPASPSVVKVVADDWLLSGEKKTEQVRDKKRIEATAGVDVAQGKPDRKRPSNEYSDHKVIEQKTAAKTSRGRIVEPGTATLKPEYLQQIKEIQPEDKTAEVLPKSALLQKEQREKEQVKQQNQFIKKMGGLASAVNPLEAGKAIDKKGASDTAATTAGGTYWAAAKELKETFVDSKEAKEVGGKLAGWKPIKGILDFGKKLRGKDSKKQLRDDTGKMLSVDESQKIRGKEYRSQLTSSAKKAVTNSPQNIRKTIRIAARSLRNFSGQGANTTEEISNTQNSIEKLQSETNRNNRESSGFFSRFSEKLTALKPEPVSLRDRDNDDLIEKLDEQIAADEKRHKSQQKELKKLKGGAGGFGKSGGKGLVTALFSMAAGIATFGGIKIMQRFQSINEDDGLNEKQKTAKKTGTIAGAAGGTLAGGVGGILAGVKLGAAAGSVAPGLGTVIGAGVGALGGAAGLFLGSSFGSWWGDKKSDRIGETDLAQELKTRVESGESTLSELSDDELNVMKKHIKPSLSEWREDPIKAGEANALRQSIKEELNDRKEAPEAQVSENTEQASSAQELKARVESGETSLSELSDAEIDHLRRTIRYEGLLNPAKPGEELNNSLIQEQTDRQYRALTDEQRAAEDIRTMQLSAGMGLPYYDDQLTPSRERYNAWQEATALSEAEHSASQESDSLNQSVIHEAGIAEFQEKTTSEVDDAQSSVELAPSPTALIEVADPQDIEKNIEAAAVSPIIESEVTQIKPPKPPQPIASTPHASTDRSARGSRKGTKESIEAYFDEQKLAKAIEKANRNTVPPMLPAPSPMDIPTEFDDALLTLIAYDHI